MDERFVMERVRQHAGPAASAGPQRRGRPEAESAVPRPRAAAPAPSAYDRRDPVLQIEREALKLAVQRPALCGPVFDALGAACFTAPVHAAAFEIVIGCGGAGSAPGGRQWAEQLRNAAGDDQLRGFMTQLAVEPLQAPRADGEPDPRYASEVLTRIEELAVSRQIAQIKSKLQRMNPVTEQVEYHRMFGDLIALEQRHRVLIEPAADALQERHACARPASALSFR
jgi:DNA primase